MQLGVKVCEVMRLQGTEPHQFGVSAASAKEELTPASCDQSDHCSGSNGSRAIASGNRGGRPSLSRASRAWQWASRLGVVVKPCIQLFACCLRGRGDGMAVASRKPAQEHPRRRYPIRGGSSDQLEPTTMWAGSRSTQSQKFITMISLAPEMLLPAEKRSSMI